mgnify:CR=1 FL=1
MLFTKTVSPNLFRILKSLSALPALKDFPLVGGTNLALRFGHRESIDIDLFQNEEYDKELIKKEIIDLFPETQIFRQSKFSIACSIENIKIDIVLHQYPYLKEIEILDGIKFLSVEDVAAMKLNAIAQRGAKKDFWDLALLLNFYSVEKMLQLYSEKYANHDIGFVLLSMSYFENAESFDDPVSFNNYTWTSVKTKIQKEIKDYYKKNNS